MTSIVELFPKCRKLAYDARQQLSMVQQQQQQQQQYYNGSNSGRNNSTISPSDVMMILNELNFQLQYMESTLLPKEIPQQRMIWSRKIKELQQESQLLLQQCHTTTTTAVTTMKTGSTTTSTTTTASSYSNERDELLNVRQRRRQQHPSNESDLQNLSKESDSIQNSHSLIVDIISSGEASYQELKSQRRRMNTMTSILYNISDTIGLSQFTIQIIERRDITDAYYVIGGMIITLIVLYVTWFM
jgi:Golgi SNAP receptor complex protein 2